MPRQLFVNLAVCDLERSKRFFSSLGFEFNPQFTNDKATCMIVGREAFVMLLVEPFFKNFTKKEICVTGSHTEAMLAISANSRAEVDALVEKALAAGGKRAKEPEDHGFMYASSFYDLDGHHWEFFWMDGSAGG